MRISQFRQTALVGHDGKNLALFSVDGWDFCNPYRVSVYINGEKTIDRQKHFSQNGELYIPCVEKNAECLVEVTPFEQTPVGYKTVLNPVKQREVSFMSSSHEDLGYCAYVDKLLPECADFTDKALELCERDEGYRYTIEHMWWLSGYEKYRTPREREKLKKALAEGKISLSATHSGTHTHWQGYEQLLRSLYFGRVKAWKEWGVKPDTVIYADISGMTWAAVSAYVHMGVRYAVILPNSGFRLSREGNRLPPVFYWDSPNGKDSLLCMYQSGYREKNLSGILMDGDRQVSDGEYTMDESKTKKASLAIDAVIRKTENIGYDDIPIAFYDDREEPTDMLLKVCGTLNGKWRNPHFRMASPRESLIRAEQLYKDKIPHIKGELGEQWSDFITISPDWTAKKREAERMFTPAEAWACCMSLTKGTSYPAEALDDAVWRMCEYDEHCWATSSKHPLEMHRFNLKKVKEESAEKALGYVGNILPGSGSAGVMNILARQRNGYISGSVPCGESQRMSDGSYISYVRDIKPFGVTVPGKAEVSDACLCEKTQTEFQTGFYKITADGASKRIISITDKETGLELLDKNARFPLGEYIYTVTEGKRDQSLSFETPYDATLTAERGKLALKLTLECTEEQSGADIKTEFVFYERDKTIDMTVEFSHASGLMGDYYDRYKKNVFISVPLLVKNHRFRTELAGCTVDETSQRIHYNPRDFVTAYNWVAAENEDGGIAVLSDDMPLFDLGGIHYNELSSETDYSASSNVYIYAASNRCNQLNFTDTGKCHGKYRVSLLPYTGSWSSVLPLWSAEHSMPLYACGEETGNGYIELDKPNVRLLAFKKAEYEDGVYILRVAENAGIEDTEVRVKLPLDIKEAFLSDGAENVTDTAVRFEKNTVILTPDAYGYETVMIKFTEE